MKRNAFLRSLALAAYLMIVASASASDQKPADKPSPNANPLLTESTLPYQMPLFDEIKNEHFQPAIEQGMVEQLKEIEKIAADQEKPTFENTIVAMERSGRLLQRANRTFSNLNGCNTNPEMQRIDKELSPKLSAHQDAIRLNRALFARIEKLYNDRANLGLDAESKFLLERYYKDFIRAGAKLNDVEKTKLKAMNTELATLQTQFEQNVLKEKNASSILVETREELDGLKENGALSFRAAPAIDLGGHISVEEPATLDDRGGKYYYAFRLGQNALRTPLFPDSSVMLRREFSTNVTVKGLDGSIRESTEDALVVIYADEMTALRACISSENMIRSWVEISDSRPTSES